jgi:hypothetical protein
MTDEPVDVSLIMACLSREMIDKVEYACHAYIKEVFVLKNNEESKGNVEEYKWLINLEDHQYRISLIQGVIEDMFSPRIETEKVRLSVISDYFVPEDLPMLKTFSENYYIHYYKNTQNDCEILWKRRMFGRKNTPLEYSNMVCELAMYFYMDLNEEFVLDIYLDIYNGIETNTAKLK